MVKILNKELSIPIIQGGMGMGVSLGRLAGSVAACGGMGIISSVNAGYREPDFDRNPFEANIRALKSEIKKAFDLAEQKGMVGVNIMVAVSHYEETVKAAVEAGVDAIISGAGLPLKLPEFTKGTQTAAAPIVSSGKAASVICKSWDRNYRVIPDFMVLEGPLAGGHLGFTKEEVKNKTAKPVEEILPDVLQAIAPYEEKYGRKIPVFVAGGIFDGKDMAKMTKLGAAGVQMATRFITTHECDAAEAYKQMYVDAIAEDVTIVNSPVGMPGRALRTTLIKRLDEGNQFPPELCNQCVTACPKGNKTPYCISRALISAVKGNTEDGLFFTGANVGRIDRIMSVRELMNEIYQEWRECC